MQGMLTETKVSRDGTRLHRRTLIQVGEETLTVRRYHPNRKALPRAIRNCDHVLYPRGCAQNREASLPLFQYFLPDVLGRLERIYFPDRCVTVALVSKELSSAAKNALMQTLAFAGHCILCTENGDDLASELLDEYGLAAVATPELRLIRQAELVLAYDDPNEWIRLCNPNAIVLNLSPDSMGVHYGRTVIDGVEPKPLPEYSERLPEDGDWSAFCGLFLNQLKDRLSLKHPLYARGIK